MPYEEKQYPPRPVSKWCIYGCWSEDGKTLSRGYGNRNYGFTRVVYSEGWSPTPGAHLIEAPKMQSVEVIPAYVVTGLAKGEINGPAGEPGAPTAA